MENAAKALIMAGAILIAMLIVSLGVVIFSQLGDSAKNAANMDKQEIAEFNAKITPYLGDSVSGSQVNALINYVISNNTSCKSSDDYTKAITLIYNNSDNGINLYANEGEGVHISSNKKVPTGAGKFYKVESDYSSKTGLINKITITDN